MISTDQSAVEHNTVPATLRSLWRGGMALVGLSLCLWGMYVTGRAGASRLLSQYGTSVRWLTPVDEAIRLSPADPEAYYARAFVLSEAGKYGESERAMESAVALRLRDYYFWLRLGQAREQNGDGAGALVALREAVRLAPHYNQPRWQLGNLLLRSGRRDEAFAELRRAADSNQKLMTALFDLAWGEYKGDAKAFESAVSVRNDAERRALAHFLIKQGEFQDAMQQLRRTADMPDEEWRVLLHELLDKRRFAEAYRLWLTWRGTDGKRVADGSGVLINGGFEEPINLNNSGFGWELSTGAGKVHAVIDAHDPYVGRYSLRVDFDGDSLPASPVLSQLILLKPNARYRLNFMTRTEDIVTGGPLVVVVTEGNTDKKLVLGQSKPLEPTSRGWRNYSVDFATDSETSAAHVTIQRLPCSQGPCPIFGRAWFDDFKLEQLAIPTGQGYVDRSG